MARTTITIVLAYGLQLLRAGLRAVLEAEPDFAVVAEAAHGLEVADLVERLNPDVLIVDLMLSGLDGLEVTRQVRQRTPPTHVVCLSRLANASAVVEALRNGVRAYVLKDTSAAEFVLAVREASAGRHFLSSALPEPGIETTVAKEMPAMPDPLATLTTRERQVLQLMVAGLDKVEIAARLALSPRTIERHRASLMRKLDAHNSLALVGYALRRGIISLEE
jgi:DNA-binding NarL/FixJ family response regulator